MLMAVVQKMHPVRVLKIGAVSQLLIPVVSTNPMVQAGSSTVVVPEGMLMM